ncbi:hypothetical protein HPB48_025416 [Haemaphysalis longicornis]|uniref:Endonuclease/exonuclease/phosphatase domain-containing protein n=1 Tax=Haemaphysalis longicornis TaxID=44386 RepID=A0A9J6H9S3_HAELO|nr:hypothetical protein HPB48_025416 [Haemaphysalis longicornis]
MSKCPSSRQPVILQWNCRGLSNKLGELKTKIHSGKLQVWALLLQESNKLCPLPHFIGYHTPTIQDNRSGDAPGKATVYIVRSVPQTPINLQKWCNQHQEVVAVLTRPAKTPLLLVSFYERPGRARLNLGWLHHLRATYPGTPILIGGDFNAPHTLSGYEHDTKRGIQVHDTFTDMNISLINSTAPTIPSTRSHAPDLTWWLGHGNPSWNLEPDAWASDHSPISVGLHAKKLKKLRRQVRIVHWDKVRSDERAFSLTAENLISTLQSVLAACTIHTTVNEDQPTPDMHHLKLWAERCRAELHANRHPTQLYARVTANRIAAQARRYEKQLSRRRWNDWCAGLGSGTGNKALWRTFHAMERGGSVMDPSASIRLALNISPRGICGQSDRQFISELPTTSGRPSLC